MIQVYRLLVVRSTGHRYKPCHNLQETGIDYMVHEQYYYYSSSYYYHNKIIQYHRLVGEENKANQIRSNKNAGHLSLPLGSSPSS